MAKITLSPRSLRCAAPSCPGRRRGVYSRMALLIALTGLLAVTSGGCGQLFAWAFAERHPKEKVKAEYPLEADRLVIVTYAGTEVLFSDPTAPLVIGRDLVNEILKNIRPQIKTIVHPVEVVRWQESNIEWPNMALTDIAKIFQADTLLYVEIEQLTTVEERSANLFRGRIRAHVQVVKAKAERNPVYETNIETTFPEDRPVGVLETSEQTIRTGVGLMFTREVIRKFYEHEVEVKGGRP